MTITPDTFLDSAAVAARLSTRARNAMNHMRRTRGMHTVRDFASCRSSELLELRNCGIGTLDELTRLIREAGLKWAIPLADQPKAKPALPKVVQLATAGQYLYALMDDGTVWRNRQPEADNDEWEQINFTDPESRAHLTAATEAADARRFYQAMKALRNLLPRETRLLSVRPD